MCFRDFLRNIIFLRVVHQVMKHNIVFRVIVRVPKLLICSFVTLSALSRLSTLLSLFVLYACFDDSLFVLQTPPYPSEGRTRLPGKGEPFSLETRALESTSRERQGSPLAVRFPSDCAGPLVSTGFCWCFDFCEANKIGMDTTAPEHELCIYTRIMTFE